MTTSRFRSSGYSKLCKAISGVATAIVFSLSVSTSVLSQEIRIGGTGAALGTMQLLAQAYSKQQPKANITVLPSLGSGGGIKAVLSGAIQLAVSSRALTDAEIKQGAVGIEYGRSPFAFAASPSNPVSDVSTSDLIDIYSGKTEQWSDGKRIRLVLRPVGDSDSELIKSISPEVRAAKESVEQRKGMSFAVTDQEAADTMEKAQGAFGPITLAQLLTEKRALKPLKFNGVAPDAKNLVNGTYRLYKTFLLVTGPGSPAEVQKFIAFVRSPSGQTILQRSGYWVK